MYPLVKGGFILKESTGIGIGLYRTEYINRRCKYRSDLSRVTLEADYVFELGAETPTTKRGRSVKDESR